MNAIIQTTLTMSSREIAKLCEKQHQHVKRDFLNLCSELEIDASKFGRIYKDSQNREQTEYRLDKDLTLTLVSGYKAKIRYAIVKRWRELEDTANPKSTSIERTELRQAVTEASARLNMLHSDVYLSVHKRFNVQHIDDIPLIELPEAVAFVKALRGEYLGYDEQAEDVRRQKIIYRRAAVMMMNMGKQYHAKQRKLLRDAQSTIDKLQKMMKEIESCQGAINDGLSEAQFYLCFDNKVMREGREMAHTRYELQQQ